MESTLIGLIILCLAYHVRGVRITNLYVPLAASHEAPLDCKYDLEGAKLYDVKWYKDGEQFFRCMPSGEVQEFAVEGLKIYHTGLAIFGSCPLTLTGLNFKSGGQYVCEVSTEGPVFETASESARLRVLQSFRRIQDDSTMRNDEYSHRESAKSAAISGGSGVRHELLFIYLLILYLLTHN